MIGPPCKGLSRGWGRHCLSFQNENRVFVKVNFARWFKTPDGRKVNRKKSINYCEVDSLGDVIHGVWIYKLNIHTCFN